MRFFRRARHNHRNVASLEENPHRPRFSQGIPGQLHWNPFFRHQNRYNPVRIGINPFQNCVNNHVPKCLGRVSMSNILQGDRVENFSSECWLQDHLHQFGYVEGGLPNVMEEREEEGHSQSASLSSDGEEDDSPAGSDIDTINDSPLGDFDFHDSDDGSPCRFMGGMTMSSDIASYTEAIELPPYDFPGEPPPSYEEATGGVRRRQGSRGSRSSSDIAFLW